MTPPSSPPYRSAGRQVLLWAAAAACFSVAALVIVAAGLPDRAAVNALYALPDGRAVAPEVGAVAPPLDLATADGDRIRLADYRGRVIVLNYWATWCAPCQVEMPALQQVASGFPGQVAVLGINAGEPAADVLAWRDRLGLTFPLLLDPDGIAARDYRLRGQPTTVIVTPDSHIAAIFYGPVDAAAITQAVAALLPDPDERTAP
jgi:peroxiredoxin